MPFDLQWLCSTTTAPFGSIVSVHFIHSPACILASLAPPDHRHPRSAYPQPLAVTVVLLCDEGTPFSEYSRGAAAEGWLCGYSGEQKAGASLCRTRKKAARRPWDDRFHGRRVLGGPIGCSPAPGSEHLTYCGRVGAPLCVPLLVLLHWTAGRCACCIPPAPTGHSCYNITTTAPHTWPTTRRRPQAAQMVRPGG